MAKRDTNNNDRDYVFANNENLEKQAELMQRMADDVLKRFETGYESIAARISSNYQKEYSKLEKAINEANADREKRRNESSSFKENLYTNILNQTGAGQKFDTNWKSVGLTIGRELVQGIERAFSTYLLDPIKTGFSEMSATYEREFTEIAGRMGTNRSETYDTMKGAIDRLMDTSAKWAVDINRDLIPALREATKQGFQGDRAEEIALSNAIDKRIMPWLDTASDTWANLAFNLDKNAMQQIKGQQLLLQASESGNRLLQSGVINQLTSDISPALMNIDFKMGTDNLSPQYQAMMNALVDVGKMDPQQAYQMVQDVIKAQQNPAQALESGTYSGVMMGQAALLGENPIDIMQAGQYGYDLMASTGNFASFVGNELALNMGNGYYTDYNAANISKAMSVMPEYIENPELAAAKYSTEAENVSEKSTATESWDTYIKNQTTNAAYTLNTWPHGPDTLLNIAETVGNIAKAIIGGAIGNAILNKLLGGGGSGKGLLSKLFGKTSGSGSSIASKITNKGLVNRLPIGNASLFGTGATHNGAAALGAGTAAVPLAAGTAALAGTAIGAYGVSKGVEDIQNDNTGRGIASIAGGTAAAVGGIGVAGGMLAAGAVNAWNPVGWGLLIGGGLTVAATALHREFTKLTETEKDYIEELEQSIETSKEVAAQEQKNVQALAEKIQGIHDPEDKKEAAKESGIVNEADLSGMTGAQVDSYSAGYERLNTAITTNQQDALSSSEKIQKKVAENAVDENAKTLATKLSEADSFETQRQYLSALGISDWEINQMLIESNRDNIDKLQFRKVEKTNPETGMTYYDDELVDAGGLKIDYDQLYIDGWINSALESALKYNDVSADTVKSYIEQLGGSYSDIPADAITSILNDYTLLDTLKTYHNRYTVAKAENNESQLDNLLNEGYGETLENRYVEAKSNLLANIEKYPYISEIDDKYTKENVENSFAVGASYIPHNQIAMLHQGEAVLTKQENEKRLEGLLPTQSPVESNKEAAQITANEVVNAIKSQTTEVLAALQQIINRLSSNQLTSIRRNDNESLRTMMPQIANTRNLT